MGFFVRIELDKTQRTFVSIERGKRVASRRLVSTTPDAMQPIVTTTRRWPAVLLPFKLLAKEGDTGLGDIVERVVGPVGGDVYKKWYKKVFGRPCGCETHRKPWLNNRYPL